MADPKDKSGTAGGPKPPPSSLPAMPSIPRLTPAIPEPVIPAQPAPKPPAAPPPRPAFTNTPPQVAPIPRVAPLIPAVPRVAQTPRPPPAPKPPPVLSAQSTGSFPAVPAVAPVSAPAATPSPPRVAPILPPAASKPVAPASGESLEDLAELERRFAVLEQLDYFEVMGLEATAAPADIKRAFHHQSRTYHPDRYFQSTDLALRDRVHAVYKRVTEAYFVLRDDARRRKYLADISGPERLQKLRFDELAEAETKAAVKKEVAEQIGTHPKGRQFFQVGVADLEAGRLVAAERNIKLALTYEPTNPLYLQKLEETRTKAHEEYKRSGRGFRIE
jgi:DnaJ-domain-containing protein 1